MYSLHSFRTNSKLRGEQRQKAKRQGFLERTSMGLKTNRRQMTEEKGSLKGMVTLKQTDPGGPLRPA